MLHNAHIMLCNAHAMLCNVWNSTQTCAGGVSATPSCVSQTRSYGKALQFEPTVTDVHG